MNEDTILREVYKILGLPCPEAIAEIKIGELPEKISGSTVVLEDNKTATITENGTVVIEPTAGKDGMKKVTLTVNVAPSEANE